MISFLKKYIRKFHFAFSGLFHGITHDHSILLQVLLGFVVLVVCLCFHLTCIEWCIIIVVIGAVIAFEFVNSAIETIVDMISPNYHEDAKKIKDYAAAAVLVISFAAAVVGILIIGGKIW